MKFLIQLFAILISAFVLQLFFPWWTIAITAFAFGYLLKSNQNFFSGFLAIALLWGGYAFFLDSAGAAPLAERVAGVLSINKTLLFFVTSLLGGLVAGFACLTGSLLKTEKRKSSYY
jgi:hypothetical protein